MQNFTHTDAPPLVLKRWRPVYNVMVALDECGVAVDQIGFALGYTNVYVRKVLELARLNHREVNTRDELRDELARVSAIRKTLAAALRRAE